MIVVGFPILFAAMRRQNGWMLSRLWVEMNPYGRADVLRILHISAKQLVGWQRAGLAPHSDSFSFTDLVQLQAIRDLRANGDEYAGGQGQPGMSASGGGRR